MQIKASNEELEDRIEKFASQKREEINQANNLEFCAQASSEESCARTDAVLVRKKDSKSHLRKSVVANQVGPSMTKVNILEK